MSIEPVPWPGVGGHPLDVVFVHVIEDPRWSDEDQEYQTWCSCGWTAEGDKSGIWYAINQHQELHPGARVRE